MLRRLRAILGLNPPGNGAPPDLPELSRSEVAHLLRVDHGLPHVDWHGAAAWIARTKPDATRHAALQRAVAACWLDELRDALPSDHRRWRHAQSEGLGPLENDAAMLAAKATARSLAEIARALRPLRGGAPIPPIAVIALATNEEYYSFISRHYPDEGHFATSGGVYLGGDPDAFPMIALPVQTRWAVGSTIAHELTHHALRGLSLPAWLEEGFTQMMEERVTGEPNFSVTREIIERHRARWSGSGLRRFWEGESFHSSHEDEQELAYHLSQLIVRSMLTDRASEFFAFARLCKSADSVDAAARETLGLSLEDLAANVLGPGEYNG